MSSNSRLLLILILMYTLFTVKAVDQQVNQQVNQQVHCTEGEPCLLPCLSVPGDQEDPDVEWQRHPSDGRAVVVHFNGDGHDRTDTQDPTYRGRTTLDKEGKKEGNMSLTLRQVKKSDEGRYTCVLYPGPRQRADLQLKVFPNNRTIQLTDVDYVQVSTPEVTMEGHGRDGGVALQCQSGGWPSEPQLEWRDSEGRLLSAGVPQTDRDADGRYTVRSNVTVQKTATNRFTCGVQLQNHTRDKTIRVPDEFFPVTSNELVTEVGVLPGGVVGIVILSLVIGTIIGGMMVWMKYRKLISARNGLQTNGVHQTNGVYQTNGVHQINEVEQQRPLTNGHVTVNKEEDLEVR